MDLENLLHSTFRFVQINESDLEMVLGISNLKTLETQNNHGT